MSSATHLICIVALWYVNDLCMHKTSLQAINHYQCTSTWLRQQFPLCLIDFISYICILILIRGLLWKHSSALWSRVVIGQHVYELVTYYCHAVAITEWAWSHIFHFWKLVHAQICMYHLLGESDSLPFFRLLEHSSDLLYFNITLFLKLKQK